MKTSLTKQMQSVVLAGDMPAKEVAMCIDKPYPTLMRELNPYDDGAKLGAETMLEIMKVTGDIRMLHYLAREMGCRVVSDPLGGKDRRRSALQPAWA